MRHPSAPATRIVEHHGPTLTSEVVQALYQRAGVRFDRILTVEEVRHDF